MAQLNNVYLDFLELDKILLYGWERKKSDRVVDSIIKGIEKNVKFPPLYVVKASDKIYKLSTVIVDYNQYYMPNNQKVIVCDGGHHRAVGHYITSKPLKVMVLDGEDKTCFLHTSSYLPISLIEIVEDSTVGKGKDYQSRKNFFINYG
jgi:hypothetical protein